MVPMRAVLRVTLLAVMVMASAGSVLAAPTGGSGAAPAVAAPQLPTSIGTEPGDAATANQAGRADVPCAPEEEPPPPPPPLEEEVPPPPPPCAYHVAGGANYLKIDAVVCDITQPFTVTGGKITVHFTPSSGNPLSGGTYRYSGDFGKFSVAGQGTYKVKLTVDGGSIVAKGPGTATTPRGTFTANGKEHYALTPTSC